MSLTEQNNQKQYKNLNNHTRKQLTYTTRKSS